MIDRTAIIHAGVSIGPGMRVEEYCIIGTPPRGSAAGELLTEIGPEALLRSHTVIYAGNRIGCRFQTGNKVNIRERNAIGDDVSIGTLSVVEHHVEIGDRVRIHSQVFIPEFSVLEDECWIGPNAVLTNAKFPMSPDAKNHLRGPLIRRRAKIGANATILPGVVIGADALVGAGAVVSRDVPEGAVVAGNPARVIKHLRDLPYERIGNEHSTR
jgi:acetyltransferase-like isoleucine patch superfamily enzyme